MPSVADAQISFSPVLTEDKSIAEVLHQIEDALRGTELEPEWISTANSLGDDNEAMYGPRPDRGWPGASDRLAISLYRGWSEGWIIYVDHIFYIGESVSRKATVQKLLVCKTLTRQYGWDVLRAISKMLDVT
ncbi:hypothetical protein [Cupriavidus pampae]|uniref:Uncharacterized protein n=1 Tax=Cupriavidus pampae TaxID=659251 RepID=A0ABN7ZL88_9BURK|nr:hypothetical protein [Cupriavidus pampae]CAG9185745.1 hypothetical protein LMG32289_06086 [Cupriavidus pampae]